MTNYNIGDYMVLHKDGCGWYAAMLCGNPGAAFWQQMSKTYQYRKCAERYVARVNAVKKQIEVQNYLANLAI